MSHLPRFHLFPSKHLIQPLNPLQFSSLLFSIRMDSAPNNRLPTSPSSFLPLRYATSTATQSFLDENKESVTVSESAPHSQTESLQPRPLECLHEPRVPPFLCKTYDIVDDPLLDGVISWAPAGNSFVVWNPPQFERAVLPTHFKHANFSSFVRQLNTYGFRKTSADRWEFANEGFLRGSKHLLKNINRRRSQGGPQIDYNSLEIIKQPHVEAEVQNLRRDRNKLVEEVSRLRQDQVITLQHMDSLNHKMESAEQRQKQMVSFMAKIMENPAFTACLKNHQQHRMQRKFLKLQRSDLSQPSSLQQQEQKQQSEEKEMKVEVQPNVKEALYPDTPILSLPELEMHASTSARSLKGKNVINDVSSDLPTAHYMIADETWCSLNKDPTQLEFIEPCWDMDLQLDGFEDLGLFNVDL